MKAFLTDVVAISPRCELSVGSIRKAMTRLVFQQASINKTIYNNALWAGLRQERITCLLNHARRLKREEDRLRQVALHIGGAELEELQKFLAKITLTMDTASCADDSEAETVFALEKTVPSARRLSKQISEVSVDKDGFPNMLAEVPESPPVEAAPAMRQHGGARKKSEPKPDVALMAAMGVGLAPAPKVAAKRKAPETAAVPVAVAAPNVAGKRKAP